MSAASVTTNLSRILLFLAFVAGIYTVDTGAASAQEVRQCATEGGVCRIPYPTEVIYGSGRRATSRFVNQPQIRCSNSVFGDPARGSTKSCSYVVRDEGRGRGGYGRDRDRYDDGDDYGRGRDGYGRDRGRDYDRGEWQRCAREGQYCDFQGRKRVRYGTQDRFVERVFRGGVRCDNRTFGDPDRGTSKSCYVLD
ncbi:hypothetical protein P8H26_12550 [Pseudochrobactrum sp. sp1633]|uniref:hypothetical protein n=1 Tax=Pseudochrobactrum sp. sp1633 TaxID=3036706 RepID=UPI0025A67DE8|nr:hypothetical protein [Pseudochrobactrum sp. sp1633]MDM8346220.1 hypothetical protein [Pseudochrobactrum sp. sp1633]HWD13713.1 hypothetical protein [Pseudochrobactrum sp.]